MGERKGTNKYYPPDYDPKKGGLNKFMGTHALRERARKLHLGIIIIRFEMPYNIWCEGCNNHIGMGVRYNAEKTKVGMYYSTPVYQFRMKCHLCDNHFEIKTDPANLDYVILSGARRQERRWDPTENGQVVPDDKQVIHKLADDAMFKLEHGVTDQKKMRDVTPSLAKLEDLQERWKDDYMANRALRDIFRAKKKEIQVQQDKDNEFLKKRSLDIPLLTESEEDSKIASLIRLQPAKSIEERQQEKRKEIGKRSKFPFALEASSSSTTATDIATEIPSNPSKSIVEHRRLSLGIRLHKRLKTESTITAAETLPFKSSESDCANNDNHTAITNVCDVSDSEIKSEDVKTVNSDIVNKINEVDSDEGELCPTTSYKETKQTAAEENKPISMGGLSSLVSYSDDSENSPAATSGSDDSD